MYDNMVSLFIVKYKVREDESRQKQSQLLSLKWDWC